MKYLNKKHQTPINYFMKKTSVTTTISIRLPLSWGNFL